MCIRDRVKAVRRRPVGVDWRDTPLARALTTADEFALLASRASASRVRHALRARKMRLLDAFRAFDGEARDGRLSYEALYGGLTWLGVELAPAQMMELAKKIDVDDVGFVTYEQFVDAFGPDDAWTEELSEQEEGDSHAEGEMRREMTEEAFYADADGDGFGAMVSAPKRDDTDLFGLSRVSGAGDTAAAEPYDPLGALGGPTRRDPEVSGSADGWGGEEDLIDFDGAAGAGRAKIEARSLSERATGAGPTPTNLQTNASRSGAPPNNTSSALLSTAAATRGVPLSRDVLSGIRVAIKPHASFARVWTSEATGSRRAASFWHAKFEQSFAARNRDRVPLGSYATPGLSDPSRYAPVNASTGALEPGAQAHVMPVNLRLVSAITSCVLELPRNLADRAELDRVGDAAHELFLRFDNAGRAMPLIDPVEDMGGSDDAFRETSRKLADATRALEAHPLHLRRGAASEASASARRRAEQIAALVDAERELSTKINATELSKFRHELARRAQVLQKLDHVDSDLVLKLKGRAACWVDTADELLVTELMFNGAFRRVDHHQLVALCSCFVPVEKSKENEDIHERATREALAEPLAQLKAAARLVGEAQRACGVPVDVDEYEDSFKLTLCEITYAWSKGANFDDVHKKTDLFEGTVTRAMRRLDELMMEMRGAARAVGDVELADKFERGAESMRHGIVFANSLYL